MRKKRHYSIPGDNKTLCGIDSHESDARNGFFELVTCRTCIKVTVACLNTGGDKLVEYRGAQLIKVQEQTV